MNRSAALLPLLAVVVVASSSFLWSETARIELELGSTSTHAPNAAPTTIAEGSLQPARSARRAAAEAGETLLSCERGRIIGWVIDETGARVAGATIQGSNGLIAVANGAGEFALEGVSAGEHWLAATAAGCVPRPAAPVRLARGDVAAEVVLAVETMQTLVGRVHALGERGRIGETIAGVRIEARVRSVRSRPGSLPDLPCWSAPIVAVSDDEGRYELSPLPPGEIELITRHPGYHEFARRYRTSSEEAQVVLTAAGAIRGQAVSATTGEPVVIDRVTVFASIDGEDGPWRAVGEPHAMSGKQAAAGCFDVPASTLRTVRVQVEGPEIAPVTSEAFRVHWKTREFGPLRLEAERGHQVTCNAVDEMGAPVIGATVRVFQLEQSLTHRTRCPDAGMPLAQRTETNGDGEATLPRLALGRYRLVLESSRHRPVEEEVVIDGCAEPKLTTIVMSRAAALRGRVHNPGGTLPSLQVIARPEHGTERDCTVAPVARGGFEMPSLNAGNYSVHVVDALTNEVEFSVRQVKLEAGSEQVVDFDAIRFGGTVSGVYHLNGKPVADAEVSLGPSSTASQWIGRTDRDGRFEFVGVVAGTYAVSARTDADRACYGVASVGVADGADVQVDLRCTTGAAAGRLLDPRGEAIARAPVIVEQSVDGRRMVVAELRTDNEGHFDAPALPAGRLLVRTEAKYHVNVDDHPLAIEPGHSAEPLVLELEPSGDVILHLKRKRGMAIASDVSVRCVTPAESESGEESPVRRFAAGERPAIAELAPGDHRFQVETSDGFEADATVRVVSGQTRTVLVEF